MLYKIKKKKYIISDEVIASVVINAASKCDGIYCFEKKPMKIKYFFHSGENLKYVDIIQNDVFFEFVIYLRIHNGYSVPKMVDLINNSVKSAVEKITEKPVKRVDVKICAIEFENYNDNKMSKKRRIL